MEKNEIEKILKKEKKMNKKKKNKKWRIKKMQKKF